MGKFKLLDLFCGEGGASQGYAEAGFEVTGVDHIHMAAYPFEFIKGNALGFPLAFYKQFDAIAASPPCKKHTTMKAFSDPSHLDLIMPTRSLLAFTGLPYVIENVPGAPLRNPITLCGSMFGLHVRRHRLFESNVPLYHMACRHAEQEANSPGFKTMRYHSGKPVEYTAKVVSVYGRGNGYGAGETELWRDVMGMPWATKDGLREAIPPAYTRYIGEQLINYLEQQS